MTLLMVITAMACYTPVTHDYYLFSVYHRDLSADFNERCDQNWAAYTQGEITSFDYEELLAYAQKHGDKQMATYIRLLNQYVNGICSTRSNQWDYPGKEELAQQKVSLRNIRTQAQTALKSRLRSQNALLVMRCNMMLEQHEANISFWQQWEKRLPNSVYHDMMRNIYAGALCHVGRQDEACEIFAEQGDMTSIRYCMYDDLSYKGIKKVYDRKPNSAALPWLVQTFVNDAQSVLHEGMGYELHPDEVKLTEQYKTDVRNFIALANRAADTAQTPVLWKTAAAWMEYMYGNRQLAQQYIDAAVKLEGTPRMKDNARAIRFYITAANAKHSSAEFDNYVAGEMEWLRQMSVSDCKEEDCWSTHYSEVADRVVFEVLTEQYDRWKRPEIANALVGSVDKTWNYDSYNPHYNNFYFDRLDTQDAAALERYLAFTTNEPKNRLHSWLLEHIYRDENFLADLIGTKYMAEGKWNKAAEWQQKVPLTFLDQQNICEYMDTRNYTTEQWVKSQRRNMDDQCCKTHLKRNIKYDFALEMSELLAKMNVANKATRQQLAYDCAVRLYQASYKGDCWFLTHYGQSVTDTARIGEKDLVAMAVSYLEEASRTTDLKLREKALYALAYIPMDIWNEEVWDAEQVDFVKRIRTDSRQYKALSTLNDFYREHPMSSYASKCDVLKEFRKIISH